jgi:hypothetical protein
MRHGILCQERRLDLNVGADPSRIRSLRTIGDSCFPPQLARCLAQSVRRKELLSSIMVLNSPIAALSTVLAGVLKNGGVR